MDPDPDPGGPKHVDPVDLDPGSDPDPQHRFQESECSEKLRTDATDKKYT